MKSSRLVACAWHSFFRNNLCCLVILLSVHSATAGGFHKLHSEHAISGAVAATTAPKSQRKRGTPLWPGSQFTELTRERAAIRGLNFIYRTALDPRNFAHFGSDYLWCFYSLSKSVRHEALRRMAHRMGIERARKWRRLHRSLPPDADANTIMDYAFGSDAADSLGLIDNSLKEKIRRAARHHPPRSYFLFDPRTEPPPDDVPYACKLDGTLASRGARLCPVCKSPLEIRSRYDVWYDALITAYSGERYGVNFGATYVDVLKWLPTLRPYRAWKNKSDPTFVDSIYAVTHIIYTLNNYNQSRLPPALFPQEYQLLKSSVDEAIARDDADMLGEIMDGLRALGLTSNDPEIRRGMGYYLTHQNPDGSWGKLEEKDIYLRYHPTWNAIAGLSEYDWPAGEGLNNPRVELLLEDWKKNNAAGQSRHVPPGCGSLTDGFYEARRAVSQ